MPKSVTVRTMPQLLAKKTLGRAHRGSAQNDNVTVQNISASKKNVSTQNMRVKHENSWYEKGKGKMSGHCDLPCNNRTASR